MKEKDGKCDSTRKLVSVTLLEGALRSGVKSRRDVIAGRKITRKKGISMSNVTKHLA